MEISKVAVQGGVQESPEWGITHKPGGAGLGGVLGRGLQAPAMENHWPWPAGPGKTPFGPSGCLVLYTSLRVFINTLFRVAEVAIGSGK